MSRQPRAGTPAVSINFFFSSIETIFLSRTCHPSQQFLSSNYRVQENVCVSSSPAYDRLHSSALTAEFEASLTSHKGASACSLAARRPRMAFSVHARQSASRQVGPANCWRRWMHVGGAPVFASFPFLVLNPLLSHSDRCAVLLPSAIKFVQVMS